LNSTTKLWMAAPLTLGLVLAGCSGDDGDDADADVTDAPATAVAAATEVPEADPTAAPGAEAAAGTLLLGDEEIAMAAALCWFQEQPRAGLGGVYTHTAQAEGTNAEGEAVLLDVTRARAEDGTVEDDIIIDIGDYTSEDAVSFKGGGPEGTIEFGDDSASADGLEITDFETGPVSLTFDISCR
jgi:hypothetical protein